MSRPGEEQDRGPDRGPGKGPEGPDAQGDKRRMAAAYQGAIEAVLAVVISAGFGWWLDQRFGTAPRFLFAGCIVGFAAFMVRLWRLRGLMGSPGDDGRPPAE